MNTKIRIVASTEVLQTIKDVKNQYLDKAIEDELRCKYGIAEYKQVKTSVDNIYDLLEDTGYLDEITRQFKTELKYAIKDYIFSNLQD
jgi:hypothetical protein